MLQHGAYTLLLDACYDRERFPTEVQAIEWTWASTPEEEQAVRFVLSRFFEEQEDGTYVQTRVYEEIQAYKIGEIQNRLIALSREAKKQKRKEFAEACDQLRAEIKNDPLEKTHAAWTSVVDALIKSHECPPNHKPLTTNQLSKKSTKKENAFVLPDEINAKAWADLDNYRKNSKTKKVRDSWTDDAKNKTCRLLKPLPHEDQQTCIDMTIANGWQGIFPDKIRRSGNATNIQTGGTSQAESRRQLHKEAYRRKAEEAAATQG